MPVWQKIVPPISPGPVAFMPSTSTLRWNGTSHGEGCEWVALEPFDGPQPSTIDDLSLQDIVVRDEYPAWCVDDAYAPVIHDGTAGESPL